MSCTGSSEDGKQPYLPYLMRLFYDVVAQAKKRNRRRILGSKHGGAGWGIKTSLHIHVSECPDTTFDKPRPRRSSFANQTEITFVYIKRCI